MSQFFEKKSIKAFNNRPVMVESFESGREAVEISKDRPITDSSFTDQRTRELRESWHGVKDFAEAEDLMANGYQPTVEALKGIKMNAVSDGKRTSFRNEVCGFAPVVPLYLQGVPKNMISTYMKPIKSKVINVYYNFSASAKVTTSEILEAGKKLIGAILALERRGYRFNLYVTQDYGDKNNGSDKTIYMMAVKVKGSNTPLDLKRMSFQLSHPAFLRVIGFDWYSRCPKAKYISMYGYPVEAIFGKDCEQIVNDAYEEIFDKKCVVFTCQNLVNKSEQAIENSILASEKKVRKS